MTSQDDKFERVLASLHEAMLDDALWRATSALIDDACGLKGSALGLLDRRGFLRARFQSDNVRLEALLARALPTFERQGVDGSMTARRSSDLPRLAVHVSPVGGPRMILGISRVAALVLVVEPGRQPHIDSEVVAAALDLTPAETQVAVSMARVYRLSTMRYSVESRLLGIAVNGSTVRTHG